MFGDKTSWDKIPNFTIFKGVPNEDNNVGLVKKESWVDNFFLKSTPRPNIPIVQPKYLLTQNVYPPQISVVNSTDMSQVKGQNITIVSSTICTMGGSIRLEAAGNKSSPFHNNHLQAHIFTRFQIWSLPPSVPLSISRWGGVWKAGR